MKYYDIEREFLKEVRDKKRIGRGISNRASRKKGFKGGIRFPSDSLTNKEKQELNGDVIVSNMYDNINNIIKPADFNKYSYEEIRNMLIYIKAKYPAREIAEYYGIQKSSVGYYYKKYKVPTSRRGGFAKTKAKSITENNTNNSSLANVEIKDNSGAIEKDRYIKELENKIKHLEKVNKGLAISVNATYTKEELSERLLNLATILDDNYTYNVSISILEDGKIELINNISNSDNE